MNKANIETPKEEAQRMRDESHRDEEQKCEECNCAGTHKHFFNDEYIYLCDYHFNKMNNKSSQEEYSDSEIAEMTGIGSFDGGDFYK